MPATLAIARTKLGSQPTHAHAHGRKYDLVQPTPNQANTHATSSLQRNLIARPPPPIHTAGRALGQWAFIGARLPHHLRSSHMQCGSPACKGAK
jgi:hypothetical protein